MANTVVWFIFSRSTKKSFTKPEEKMNDNGKNIIIKLDKIKIKCFNHGKSGHFPSKCKQTRNSYDWTSSFEDEIDYKNIEYWWLSP